MEGAVLGVEPPAARGQWWSGSKAPSRRRLGVWGQSPQPQEAGGLGVKPPAARGTGSAPSARKVCIFLQK